MLELWGPIDSYLLNVVKMTIINANAFPQRKGVTPYTPSLVSVVSVMTHERADRELCIFFTRFIKFFNSRGCDNETELF